MILVTADSLLPAWAVVPVAAAAIIVLAAHVLAMQQTPMPPRRRRIRTANGLLMMLVASMLAYALGVAPAVGNPTTNPGTAKSFLIIWSAIMSLLTLIIALAALDVAHTARLALSARKRLRDEFRAEVRAPGASRDGRRDG